MTVQSQLNTAIDAYIQEEFEGTLAEISADKLNLENLLEIQQSLAAGGGASSANQTAVQAPAGDDAAKAVAVQGITGGKAVAITGETGLLSYRNTALTNTAVQVKATSGSIRGWNFINVNTVPIYIKFYDALAANVAAGTTAVKRTLAVPASGVFFLEAQSVSQEDFDTAISMACVTGLADSSTAAPATAIHASVRYK